MEVAERALSQMRRRTPCERISDPRNFERPSTGISGGLHRAIADFRGVWPNGLVVELPGVGHFCQEDAPETLVSNIVQFLQST